MEKSHDFWIYYDIIDLLSQYLDRIDLLNLLSISKRCRQFDNVFYNRYFIDTYIIAGQTFDKNWAKKIKKIKNFYNLELLNHFPMIKEIMFHNDFNESINDGSILPNTLTHITFGENFNQSINNLPNSMFYLKFGRNFDQTIDHLPDSIIHLEFDQQEGRFNQPTNK